MAVVSTVAGGVAGDALSCCAVVVAFVAGAVSVATAGTVTNNGSAVVSVTTGTASLSASITVAGGDVMPPHAETPFGSVWHCHEPAACGVVHVTDSRVHSTNRTDKRVLMSVKTGWPTGCVTISGV